MRREDWLWLLVKAAGLWLVVTAIEVLSSGGWTWFESTESPMSGREQLLQVLVPLVGGLLLLLVDFSRWLPLTPVAAEQTDHDGERPGRHLSRADVLWVGLKIVGAYYAVQMVVVISQYGMMGMEQSTNWWWALVMPVGGLAAALWLLFGETLWRLAAREPKAGDPAAKPPQLLQYLFVVLVFAALIAIPVLLLWWAGGMRR